MRLNVNNPSLHNAHISNQATIENIYGHRCFLVGSRSPRQPTSSLALVQVWLCLSLHATL